MLTFPRLPDVKTSGTYRMLIVLVCISALAVLAAGCDAPVPAEPKPPGIAAEGPTNSAVPPPTDSASTSPIEPAVTSAAIPSTPDASNPESPTLDNNSASGDHMPVGDLPGWRQVFAGDFAQGDVPVGAFPGPAYGAKWSAGYGDGTPDTAGQVSGGKSGYYPSKVLSVRNGALDWYLHSENGISMGAAPAPVIPNTSASPHRPNSQLYGRYSVRFRADSLPGFKTAWLMWPDSGAWPRDGELDYPEGDLAGTFYGAVHRSGSSQDVFDQVHSNALFTSWHTATTEWTPGRVTFLLDGKPIGAVTTGTPVKPMHYILQTESCLTGCPTPTTAGHVQVAWVAIWAMI